MNALAHLLPRPALPSETLPARGCVETPVVALFDRSGDTGEALRRAGLRHWREASQGVVVLAPSPGLRERLYAAGALVVVE